MDLETELRRAMAEQVADAAAPPSLVADVRRRHRRRVTRIRVTVGVAAAAVAVVAVAPGYQSFRAQTVGSNGEPDGKGGPVATAEPERSPAPVVPGKASPTAGGSAAPTTGEPATRGDGGAPDREPSDGGGEAPAERPSWVTFIPSGLSQEAPCASRQDGRNTVTTCRWRGADGWVEIKVVRGSGFTGPEELIRSPGVPRPSSVRGAKALTVERSDASRQIAWTERPGVGVTVTAGGDVRDQLVRIAEGVRP